MKKITDMKKMGALALGLMAFAPAAMAQDKVETSMGADAEDVCICILCSKDR